MRESRSVGGRHAFGAARAPCTQLSFLEPDDTPNYTSHLLVHLDLLLREELDALRPAFLTDDLPKKFFGQDGGLVDGTDELGRRCSRRSSTFERRNDTEVGWERRLERWR